jgi:restriction system protein
MLLLGLAECTFDGLQPVASNMAIPDYQTLMLPVLESAAQGEISVKECTARLADRLRLSDEERSELLPSGRQAVFANRVHWAKTYLVQAGLLEITRRAHFTLTPRGSEVMARHPAKVDNELLMQFAEFREFRERSRSRPGNGSERISEVLPLGELVPATTPEDRIETAYTEITNELRAALLDGVTKGTPQFFEKVVVDLLTSMGYGGSRANAGRRVGKTADGGIDGIINEDPLGLDVVYLQAKRYAPGNTVGVDKVREFAGSLVERGATKGVFVTTSQFAPAAKTFAERIPQRLILIDGDELTRLMVQYSVGVRTERTIELRKLDLGYFDEEAMGAA